MTAPLTQSVISFPRQVISNTFHSPAGLTRLSVCCLERLNRLVVPCSDRVAEEISPRAVTGLGLVTDRGIRRVAGVNAGIVAFLAGNDGESPLDVEDAVCQLFVPAKPFVAAVALADQKPVAESSDHCE